jgi:hypothetical protein
MVYLNMIIYFLGSIKGWNIFKGSAVSSQGKILRNVKWSCALGFENQGGGEWWYSSTMLNLDS